MYIGSETGQQGMLLGVRHECVKMIAEIRVRLAVRRLEEEPTTPREEPAPRISASDEAVYPQPEEENQQ